LKFVRSGTEIHGEDPCVAECRLGSIASGSSEQQFGHIRYALKAEESSLPVSSLLKGGTVPRQEI
jgi:hypothetical protein